MQITFLVGNGFDISLGIPASYKSFYKWYLEQPSANNHIESFKQNIKKDLKNDGENWSDFEIGLGKYSSEFDFDSVMTFIDCYEDAHAAMIRYIKMVKTHFNIEHIPESSFEMLKEGLLKFFQELTPKEQLSFDMLIKNNLTEDIEYNFLSFNYTDALDQCISRVAVQPLRKWTNTTGTRLAKINPRIIHVNGTTEQYPILAVDNPSQISNQELLKNIDFSELMIKSQGVASIGQFWHEEAEKVIDKSRIICVWGMSLGASDEKWWKKIMLWLKEDTRRQLIIFWYMDNPPNGISIRQRNGMVRALTDLLEAYAGFAENNVSERIHFVFNTEKVLKLEIPSLKETLLEMELGKI